MKSKFLGGLGLRSTHFDDIINGKAKEARWFEIISENYMDHQGRGAHMVSQIRAQYPMAMHGVSLNIGSPDPVDKSYLKRLQALAEQIEPMVVSDHLCWNGVHGLNTHELLPLPYTDETLERVLEKLDYVQCFLKRKIAIENPSSYVFFKESNYSEEQFLAEVSKRSGCDLLVDVNNIFVTCTNFSWDIGAYLQALPLEKVVQIHLAGFSDMGQYLFDTHSAPVHQSVWEVFANLCKKLIHINRNPLVMIEWDDEIPSLAKVEDELKKAKQVWRESGRGDRAKIIESI